MRRAQAIVRDLGDAPLVKYGGGDLAGVAAAHGRLDLAERMATAAVDRARQAGDRWSEGRALMTLGEVHATRGDRQAATNAYRDALDIWRLLRHPLRIRHIETTLNRIAGD